MLNKSYSVIIVLSPTEDWWSSLTPPLLLKHILVFRNALVFMLKNGLLQTHNPGVRFLLEALKMLYKVSETLVIWRKTIFSQYMLH